MRRITLGRTGIEVSAICLGTMTWGSQNTLEEACRQIDMALDRGVDFLDTAELYPVTPVSPETYGDTERFIGDWLRRSGKRDRVVIATKVAGGGRDHIRGGAALSGAQIDLAVAASLERLGTDVIDLYQLHWPIRGHYGFRRNWTFDPTGQRTEEVRAHMVDVLEALGRHVSAGRIRAVGLSNETAWGTSEWLRLAEAGHGPRMASIQNEYSLLYRLFDTDLAELSHHEDVPLLAYSPLAAGILTDKYANGAPPGSRGALNPKMGGRLNDRSKAAASAYAALARDHGMAPATLGIAFCLSRPWPTSPIVGATSEAQLAESLAAADIAWTPALAEAVDALHRQHPMPY